MDKMLRKKRVTLRLFLKVDVHRTNQRGYHGKTDGEEKSDGDGKKKQRNGGGGKPTFIATIGV